MHAVTRLQISVMHSMQIPGRHGVTVFEPKIELELCARWVIVMYPMRVYLCRWAAQASRAAAGMTNTTLFVAFITTGRGMASGISVTPSDGPYRWRPTIPFRSIKALLVFGVVGMRECVLLT